MIAAASFACGLALALAFPRASLPPLAWLAPVPWIVFTIRSSPARGFRLGYAFGLGFFGLLLDWVHGVLSHYTTLPIYLSLPIWALLIGYLALYPGLFGVMLASLARALGVSALLLAPILWVGLEFARGRLLGGFPWGAAGNAHAGGLALWQAASVGGVALVSLLIATAWSALALLALVLVGRRFPPGRPGPAAGIGLWDQRDGIQSANPRSRGWRRAVPRANATPRPGPGPPHMSPPGETRHAARAISQSTPVEAREPFASMSGRSPDAGSLPGPREESSRASSSMSAGTVDRTPRRAAGIGLDPRKEVPIACGALLGVVLAIALGAARLRAHPPVPEAQLLKATSTVGPPSSQTPGSSTEASPEPRSSAPFRLTLVQGGYGSDLDDERSRQALRDYLQLSMKAASSSPDLIVWPESNAPFSVEGSQDYLPMLVDLSRNTGARILLGSVGGDPATAPTNSAYLIGPQGIEGRYDKRRLVQYGEYVPLKGLFPFVHKFVPETGDFTPGDKVGIVKVKDRTIGVGICYEMIFAEEILRQAREGADMLVNLTNDSWFPGSGPFQHADFAPMRAIETGLWVARAASTGRTLLIDPLGRSRAALPMGGAGLLQARLPAPGSGGSFREATLFVWGGEWVGKGCVTIMALALAFLVVGNIIDRWWRA